MERGEREGELRMGNNGTEERERQRADGKNVCCCWPLTTIARALLGEGLTARFATNERYLANRE